MLKYITDLKLRAQKLTETIKNKIYSTTFKMQHRMNDVFFTRNVKLTFPIMMNLMISKSTKSIQNNLNDMQLLMLELYKNKENHTITNSAYTQARSKLNWTAFKELSDTVVDMFYQDGNYEKFKGLRLLAIDSSIITLPDNENTRKEFGIVNFKSESPDCSYDKDLVQARISCLYDVLNNIAIDGIIESKNIYERELAIQHLKVLSNNDLVIFDRGYPSYELFEKYNNTCKFLCRIRVNSFAQANFLFKNNVENNDVILTIKKTEKLKNHSIQNEINLRFVQVILDNGDIEVLVTNILDKNIINTNEFTGQSTENINRQCNCLFIL